MSGKVLYGIDLLFRLVLALIFIAGLIKMQWLMALVGGGLLALVLTVAVAENKTGVRLPPELKTFLTVFLFASTYLGGYLGFYDRYLWWDIPMHFSSGIALGVAAFLLFYTYQLKQRFAAPGWLMATAVFAFSVTAGTLWEVFEFAADSWFGFTMQVSNFDTMVDIIANCSGALVSALGVYFHLKGYRVVVFSRMVERFFSDNPQLSDKPS